MIETFIIVDADSEEQANAKAIDELLNDLQTGKQEFICWEEHVVLRTSLNKTIN
jgi:hypothetical protein